ncbi:hypothetical protein Tco_0454452 [Tanacetum coccineum]
MAASAIIISSDSSDESVGSPPSRVILFGDIPTVIPSTSVVAPETSTIAPVISSAAPMVETTLVASPTGLCGLVPYTGSDSDSPDEMTSPEHISPLPAISPFICTDSSEAPDSSDGPPSQDPYVATVARWRRRVTARPSSSHEFPIAPITAPPGIRRRKRVRPLPASRLASRHASPRSPDHHSSSSSSSLDSSLVHSLGLDAPDQAYLGSSTRDVSPILCYPPRRALRCSKAFRRWCAAPLSTWYPPTTSESSSGDSSERPMHLSSHSAGPSRKRCRSPVDSVPLFMPVTGSLFPTRADLLPPRKRFRDSYSSEASIEEDAEVGPTGTGDDMELGIGDGDEVGDHVEINLRDARDDTEEYEVDASARDTTKVGIDPMTAPSVKDMPIDLGDAMSDFYHHMSKVRVDRIIGIETAQRRLEANQLIASRDRARMDNMIYSLRLENLKVRAMLDIERDRVSSLRLHMSLSQEEFRQIRRDRDDARGRLRRLESYLRRRFGNGMTMEMVNGNWYGTGNKGGDNVHGEWFHNQQTVREISSEVCNLYLLDSALTWWNSHKRTIGTDAAYALSWRELMKLKTRSVIAREMISKKNGDRAPKKFREEARVGRTFIGATDKQSQGNVIVLQEPTQTTTGLAVRIANNLMIKRDKGARKDSKLSIISCEKAQKYIEKGCQLFLAQVTVKENKDKSEEKRLEDVPTPSPDRLAPSEDGRIVYSTTRTFRQGIYKAKFLTLGSSPVLLSKKKDGSFRMCIDYPKDNDSMEKLTRQFLKEVCRDMECQFSIISDRMEGWGISDVKYRPGKGVIRIRKRKAKPCLVLGPFKISRKCLSDKPLAIPLDEIHIDEKLNFIEEPVEIMDREIKRLKQSRIPIVKVHWNSRRGPEYTWEREDQMKKKYPHLFANPVFVITCCSKEFSSSFEFSKELFLERLTVVSEVGDIRQECDTSYANREAFKEVVKSIVHFLETSIVHGVEDVDEWVVLGETEAFMHNPWFIEEDN